MKAGGIFYASIMANRGAITFMDTGESASGLADAHYAGDHKIWRRRYFLDWLLYSASLYSEKQKNRHCGIVISGIKRSGYECLS